MKILIADDEAYIRMLLEQTLEELEDFGVEFLFAENGMEALEVIENEKPDLVLLDVMMPLMNGIEVCTKVKKGLAPEPYIILLTAKGQEIDRHLGKEAGADSYLTKPFDPDALMTTVRKILQLPV